MKKGLGYKIRKIRELKNVSQEYVASYLGISQATYSSIESDKVKIDENKLVKIAKSLHVEADVIRNFNETIVFNLWLSYATNNNLSFLEQLQATYEKLLMERDTRIKLLEKMLKHESNSVS